MKKNYIFIFFKYFGLLLLLLISISVMCLIILHSSVTISSVNGELFVVGDDMENLTECLDQIESLIVYNENNGVEYSCEDDRFDEVLSELRVLFDNSREMPALGVALDDSTRNEMKTGLWLELQFDKRLYHNDMPFDCLLVNIVPEYTGFNIIRKYDGKYDGRCFYIDLINGQTMDSLHTLLI